MLRHFVDLPLEAAIERLVRPHAALFVYHEGTDDPQLRKVHVMARKIPTTGRSAAAPGFTELNKYGRAWVRAHSDGDQFPAAEVLDAAIGWQRYLGRLPQRQRARLHERMLQAAHSKRRDTDQLAASRVTGDNRVH